jgi:two-component sensor histidine kinase
LIHTDEHWKKVAEMARAEVAKKENSGAPPVDAAVAPAPEESGDTGALTLLAQFLRLRAFGTRQQAAHFISDEIAKAGVGGTFQIEAVAGLERVFSGTGTESRIELGSYLERVCGAIRGAVELAGAMQLNCVCEAGCEVENEAAIPIALIVCELVLNAATYAHPTGVSGRIDVACRHHGRDLFVEVSDDGIGLPADFDPATDGRLGLEMVRTLAKRLGGEPHFESDPLGLQVRLTLTN